MNPLPLLLLVSAASKEAPSRSGTHAALPPVDVLASRLHSLTDAVDQMASLSRTLQALPALTGAVRAAAPLPSFPPVSSGTNPLPVSLPAAPPSGPSPQAVPFSGPPETFGASLNAMARKLPADIGQLLTPDLLQKLSSLLGK